MKILFVDQFSEFGGAQLCLKDLLDETVRRGWQVEVMAPGNGPLHAACARLGISSLALPLRSGLDSLRAGLAIRNAAKRFKPDLIYVNGPRVLPTTLLARIPIVFHAHSYPAHGYARRVVRWCVDRKQMRVLAISRFVARPFSQLEGTGRLRIVYNGVPDLGFVSRPRQRPSCVGILGRISPEKGHLDFVRAAKALSLLRPGIRFVVFGAALFSDDSYEREIRTVAEGLPIEFRGWTNDVPAALHEIDILAVPSGAGEGATRVILEAFSAGTPVVAYPSGGIPELVRHGDTGMLTSTPTHEALAKELGDLMDDSPLMSRLSNQGRLEWQARFQLQRFQNEVCDFIEAAENHQRKPLRTTGARVRT